MIETPLIVHGQPVEELIRLGFDGHSSQWLLILADGTVLDADGPTLGEWINPSKSPAVGVMCAIGGSAFIAVLALGVAWATRVGLL